MPDHDQAYEPQARPPPPRPVPQMNQKIPLIIGGAVGLALLITVVVLSKKVTTEQDRSLDEQEKRVHAEVMLKAAEDKLQGAEATQAALKESVSRLETERAALEKKVRDLEAARAPRAPVVKKAAPMPKTITKSVKRRR